ncbi:MAG: Carbohydrate-selective porin OprB related protein, partial [Cyanobacteriota bacterium]
ISEVVQVQPLMQWLINPSGSGTVPGSWIGGVQVNLNL